MGKVWAGLGGGGILPSHKRQGGDPRVLKLRLPGFCLGRSAPAASKHILAGISAGFPSPPFAWWSQVYKGPSLPRVARSLGSTEGSEMLGRILLE